MSKPKAYKSIKTKMVTYQVFIISLVICIVSIITYIVSVNLIIKDTEQIDTELVQVMNQSFDVMTTSFKRMFNYVTMHQEIQNLLQKEYSDTNDKAFHELNSRINNLVTDQTIFVDEIHGFYLFDRENLRVGFKRNYVLGEPDVIYPKLNPNDFSDLGNVTIEDRDGYLLFKRKILDLRRHNEIGYVVIIFDKSYIKKNIDTVTPNKNRFVVLLDENNHIISHNYSEDGIVYDMMENLRLENGSALESVKGIGRSIVTTNTSVLTGWRIVSVTAVKQISKSSIIVAWVILGIGAFGICLGTVITHVYTARFLKPIINLTRLVKQVEQENNFNIKFQYEGKDEIGTLGLSFNHMIEKINSLITEVYFEEIKSKEAQIQALQAQINPHFLYNTLDCINWLAEFNKVDQIKLITISFANIMKMSARSNKKITVLEEINYAKDFLTIYKVSLNEKLKYSLDVEDKLLTYMMPKLILQPLIENAIVHGIKKRPSGGSLQINGHINEGRAVFQVVDDGIGIDPERLAAIKKYAEDRNVYSKLDGIGVKNVMDRLYIFYGDRVSFTIESQSNLGTFIEISIVLDAMNEAGGTNGHSI